jgi:hypothetical protein
MADAVAWAKAFARQASVDYATYTALSRDGGLPESQRLHMLQMACEKLCKAYMFRQGVDPGHIQSTHSVVAKVLPRIFADEILEGGQRYPNERSHLMKSVRGMAREIDLLAPAVDINAGRPRPDNCEYPWDDGAGNPIAPADYAFPHLSVLQDPTGKHLLKVLARVIDRYEGSR